jgi:hypothetical protein
VTVEDALRFVTGELDVSPAAVRAGVGAMVRSLG